MFCSANWDAAPWNFGKLRAKTLMMIAMPITSAGRFSPFRASGH
jgi:hypothetical protein